MTTEEVNLYSVKWERKRKEVRERKSGDWRYLDKLIHVKLNEEEK